MWLWKELFATKIFPYQFKSFKWPQSLCKTKKLNEKIPPVTTGDINTTKGKYWLSETYCTSALRSQLFDGVENLFHQQVTFYFTQSICYKANISHLYVERWNHTFFTRWCAKFANIFSFFSKRSLWHFSRFKLEVPPYSGGSTSGATCWWSESQSSKWKKIYQKKNLNKKYETRISRFLPYL